MARRELIARAALCALVVGCATARPPAPPPAEPPPSGEDYFARRQYGAASAAFERELRTAKPADAPRLRFLLAASRLALDSGHGLAELQSLGRDGVEDGWAQLAATFARELERGTVLRDELVSVGVQLRALEAQLDELRAQLAASTAREASQAAMIDALKDERARLVAQLKDAGEAAAALTARVRALEEELAALKQIDMQRPP